MLYGFKCMLYHLFTLTEEAVELDLRGAYPWPSEQWEQQLKGSVGPHVGAGCSWGRWGLVQFPLLTPDLLGGKLSHIQSFISVCLDVAQFKLIMFE